MNPEIKNKPNGGFPPIVQCSKAELEILEKNSKREFVGVKSAISIKDIMKNKINKY
jgi:hypothetical protein